METWKNVLTPADRKHLEVRGSLQKSSEVRNHIGGFNFYVPAGGGSNLLFTVHRVFMTGDKVQAAFPCMQVFIDREVWV